MGAQFRVTLDGYPAWVLSRLSKKLGISERDALMQIIDGYARLEAEYLQDTFDISVNRFAGADVVALDPKKTKVRGKK